MASSSALFLPLLVCVCVFAFEFTMADEKVCSIGRYGALTMFNGDTADVELPCRYLLADITCGDYRVIVTPGSNVDQEHSHRFSPQSVLVKVVNTQNNKKVEMFTSFNHLAKFNEGTVSNEWQKWSGQRSLVDTNYDSALAGAVLRKDGIFSVYFGSGEHTVLVTCSAQEFVSKGLPETLCGDGTTTDAMNNAITTLFPGQEDMTVDALVSYVVLNHPNVWQTADGACKSLANTFKCCQDKERAAMECAAIFADPYQAKCLAGSDTSLRNYYADCLTSVCDADSSVVEPISNYIRDNCPWLERSCDSDADCPDGINTECFEGKCLCTPGYYYSNGQDVCVDNCPVVDLQAEFLAYPNSYMDAEYTRIPGSTIEDCQDACAADSSCIIMEFFLPYETCYSQTLSPLQIPSAFVTGYEPYILYQRRCA